MDLEFRENRNRGRALIVLGVILAVVAGGAAFFLINQAQQQAGRADTPKIAAVVATRVIVARQPIVADDIALQMVPLDSTIAESVITDPALVIGRVAAVPILAGQVVASNLLATSSGGLEGFSILSPGEEVVADSIAWRAISITVPPDLAVGGMLQPGQAVDIFVTAIIQLPEQLVEEGRYYTDRSTKLVYQNMQILAISDGFYVLKADLAVAEEIAHIQSSGTATFSLALRPDIDVRLIDATVLGATTNRLITKYGLPIPETYPAGFGPIRTPPPPPLASPPAEPTVAPSAAP